MRRRKRRKRKVNKKRRNEEDGEEGRGREKKTIIEKIFPRIDPEKKKMAILFQYQSPSLNLNPNFKFSLYERIEKLS